MKYAITAEIKEKICKFPWLLISRKHHAVLAGMNSYADSEYARFALFMGDYGYRLPDAEIIVPESINIDEFVAWPSLAKQLDWADNVV